MLVQVVGIVTIVLLRFKQQSHLDFSKMGRIRSQFLQSYSENVSEREREEGRE